jgi:hypothetical protein
MRLSWTLIPTTRRGLVIFGVTFIWFYDYLRQVNSSSTNLGIGKICILITPIVERILS